MNALPRIIYIPETEIQVSCIFSSGDLETYINFAASLCMYALSEAHTYIKVNIRRKVTP
jgi:hypothetical protein